MKITLPLLLTCTSVLFTSCDSNTPLDSGVDESELATVLSVPANGDTIIFSNTDGKAGPFLEEITLTGATTSTTSINYEYSQVTSQRFDLNAVTQSGGTELSGPLDNLLGEPVTLSSRFRELILREEADFTSDELQEVIDLLNPSGASLIIDPDDPLKILSTIERRYRFEVTSNLGDKIRGSMGGVYFAQENSYLVSFREPTTSELNKYRFITIQHKIPFITGLANGVQVTERGTFVLDLVNRNNQPR
tara:strand:+ start:1613 stop:2356 length:744 start_codon:yes stop_codon:yes gene_type:complete